MLRALMAADMEDVAIAAVVIIPVTAPSMLEHRVGGDRRAVQHVVDRLARHSARAHSSTMPATTPRDGSSGVVGTLWISAPAAVGIGKDEVGEGAADIDPDQMHRRLTRLARHRSRNARAAAEPQ